MRLIQTDATHPDFVYLVRALNAYLAATDGEDHAFYDQYNQLDSIPFVLLAFEGDEAVGCGAMKPFSSHAMEVKRMYTKPDHRGKGVASAVLQALEDWAVELGYTACVLETGKRQKEAVKLYSAQGYQRIPNYEPYTKMENSVCFEKKIS